ncbi:hypothetical protein Rs2_22315 [Raphanus sativus]|nr:hypothetical protein Rs2_37410 [Raphanus sativus]KAJ4884649.1 hypothetical protein Rs2_34742 [Raphanus sativus]KAJ4895521.1 hypothetical protein Rs2_22315 [Raphanus sativus]
MWCLSPPSSCELITFGSTASAVHRLIFALVGVMRQNQDVEEKGATSELLVFTITRRPESSQSTDDTIRAVPTTKVEIRASQITIHSCLCRPKRFPSPLSINLIDGDVYGG